MLPLVTFGAHTSPPAAGSTRSQTMARSLTRPPAALWLSLARARARARESQSAAGGRVSERAIVCERVEPAAGGLVWAPNVTSGSMYQRLLHAITY